jgi:hypothetical protein
LGPEPARFDLVWKGEPLPIVYVASILAVAFVFDFLPYVEELLRGLRASHGRLLPRVARSRPLDT